MESQLVANHTNPRKLQSYSNFVRSNPKSDRFKVKRFHHIEFWCGDATNTSLLFSLGLGMPLVAKSDLSTGNLVHASYVLRSGDLCFVFTAPYSASSKLNTASIPTFDHSAHASFVCSHGLGVRAVALEVENAESAFRISVAAGANPSAPPVLLEDGHTVLAEVILYNDVVLRFVSHSSENENEKERGNLWRLAKFARVEVGRVEEFGIKGIDHAASCVEELNPVWEYVRKISGFHEFAEFSADDLLGVADSALQAVVLANNDESVFLNFIEPVFGTKTKSPVETFLHRNNGPGVQHLALTTNDIFKTMRDMKKRSLFEFMPPPGEEYYKDLKLWATEILTDKQIDECEALGLKVDKDHEGVIIQTFTKPIGDRLTIFIEIIQRIGCMFQGEDGKLYQKGGCGGFGKGNNFSELFKSMEKYDKTLLHIS